MVVSAGSVRDLMTRNERTDGSGGEQRALPVAQPSLDDLARTVRPWAIGVATLLCRDRVHADDLVQEALARAVRSGPDVLTEETLRAWVRTTMVRLHIRHRARSLRESSAWRHLAGRREPVAIHPWTGPTSETLHALACLGARQRACVVLRYLEDLSEEQVAASLGISHGTVKAHLAQARARLRTMLDPV